jgi:hypothetical protein
VDERAVLKHFDWPERKADTLREAAFGYQDLKKLESEVSNYKDDPRIPCDLALKKMITVSEKYGQVYYKIYFISRIKLGTENLIGIPNSGRSEVFTVF